MTYPTKPDIHPSVLLPEWPEDREYPGLKNLHSDTQTGLATLPVRRTERSGSETYAKSERLLRRVWSPGRPGNLRTPCTHLMHLRRKLGEDGENPR